MDADSLNLTCMVISVVRNLYQTGTAITMHFFVDHVLTFKFADKELSQKCDILLFGFLFTELALI